jgi:exodeoxyribonuclease VII small subunit
MAMPETPIDKLTFEEAFSEFERAVQTMEAGNLTLEEALQLYERGMNLAQRCASQLDQAELRVKELAPAGDLVDFEHS